MATKKYIRTFNFDLRIKSLRQYYPSSNFLKAYSDIKKFLLKHNFEHRQWSGYKSLEPLSDREVYNIIYNMTTTFPWLKNCVNKFDVTNIGDIYDLTLPIKNILDLNEYLPQKEFSLNDLSSISENTTNKTRAMSLEEKLAQATKRAHQRNSELKSETPLHNHNNDLDLN